EDAAGRYAVKGAGLMPCATFTKEIAAQSDKASNALAWIAGYLTATNANAPGTFDIVSWQSEGMVAQALNARCNANPEEPLAQAIAAMVATMQPDAISAEERPVMVKVGRRERALYPSVVTRMQKALAANNEGLSVTGSFDESTEEALRAFQKEAKLVVTGFPDSITLYRLFESAKR
ncbi:MAG: peptidoglycan-binding domain-containing protein, partial [Pseudomonadota bacterium]